jgi:hypothetical protein
MSGDESLERALLRPGPPQPQAGLVLLIVAAFCCGAWRTKHRRASWCRHPNIWDYVADVAGVRDRTQTLQTPTIALPLGITIPRIGFAGITFPYRRSSAIVETTRWRSSARAQRLSPHPCQSRRTSLIVWSRFLLTSAGRSTSSSRCLAPWSRPLAVMRWLGSRLWRGVRIDQGDRPPAGAGGARDRRGGGTDDRPRGRTQAMPMIASYSILLAETNVRAAISASSARAASARANSTSRFSNTSCLPAR